MEWTTIALIGLGVMVGIYIFQMFAMVILARYAANRIKKEDQNEIEVDPCPPHDWKMLPAQKGLKCNKCDTHL